MPSAPSPDPAATFLADLHLARLEAIATLRRILRQTQDDAANADPDDARRTREARLAAIAILRVPLPKAPAPAAAPDPAPEDPPPTPTDDPSQARALARLEALRRKYTSIARQHQQRPHLPAASAADEGDDDDAPPLHHHPRRAAFTPAAAPVLARPP